MTTDYQVELESFRGPLDLLLFLVKRNEVDICDIPIARVAEQFIAHLKVLEMIDVERAGDFLVMAATLMEIKSKMLLPRTQEESADNEADPRTELVRQLLEYKRFKDAAALLEEQAERQLCRVARNPVETPGNGDSANQPVQAVEIWDLVSAFGRLMRETLALQPNQIIVDETPIHVYMEQIMKILETTPRLAFADVFTPPRHRGRLVGLFLAVLELIKGRKITVEQNVPFEEIWITPIAAEPGTP